MFKTPHQIPPDMESDCVLSYRQAKAITSVSADTLRRAAEREELKITRLSPRRVGIRKSELRRWLDQRTA